MADSATTEDLRRPTASFARSYGLALASVAGALLLDILFHHFNLPHPFAAFALSAIAITFWFVGTKPGIVAVLLSCLIRSFIFEGETSGLSRALYQLVFLTFAILMIWITRRKEALEVAIVGRTAELTAANEDLRGRKEQLDGLFELSPDAVILTDEDFHVLRVNKEFTRMFGYTAEESAGQWLPDLIVPEELRAEAHNYRALLTTGRRVELESIRRRKGGVSFDVSIVAKRISLGLDQVTYYLIYRDISERRKAERKLERSEANLLESQRLVHMCSWAYDASSGMVTFSPEMKRIYDIESDQGIWAADFFVERIHPDDLPAIEEIFRKARLDKTDYDASYRVVFPDGSIKHIYSVAHPVLNESGELVEFIGTSMDVTERKQAEEKIRGQEVELRQILDAAPQHLSVLRSDGSHLYINQSSLDFLGLTLEEWQKRDVRELVHPDDAERVVRERKQALSSGSSLEIEARFLRYDREYRWLFLCYKPLRDQLGRITRWVVPAIDIDDRKRSEERLHHENVALREEIVKASMFEEIVGASPALQTVLSSIVKVARTNSTVLITGETGTGKELIARAIHRHSQRSGQAFISVNCASIPTSLIASELFGHEKGAFTGAVQRRQGRFELAHSGTIFLDEVGDLPAETQITLLRVLQERQFERVGGNRILTTDVRVIAATNRDLSGAIAAGTFRSDLFYRLNVFPIEVPPLRRRKEDIPMLVEYFVQRYAEKAGKQIRRIDADTLELCTSYSWPGNIRELQNIIERSVILSSGDTFRIEKYWLATPEPVRKDILGPLPDTLQNQERGIIEAALAECKGKVAGPRGAAAKLGIPRSTLDSKISQLKIKKDKFSSD
ncbi:MAG TPA: sigma 54-interacting transcriptional regulator [Terracidiphilus sp.]|jgi:PAS domain S-box-containing protein|nr:sigma 54-interacting transcriptional regulator [Terracidiphilus sp.]